MLTNCNGWQLLKPNLVCIKTSYIGNAVTNHMFSYCGALVWSPKSAMQIHKSKHLRPSIRKQQRTVDALCVDVGLMIGRYWRDGRRTESRTRRWRLCDWCGVGARLVMCEYMRSQPVPGYSYRVNEYICVSEIRCESQIRIGYKGHSTSNLVKHLRSHPGDTCEKVSNTRRNKHN